MRRRNTGCTAAATVLGLAAVTGTGCTPTLGDTPRSPEQRRAAAGQATSSAAPGKGRLVVRYDKASNAAGESAAGLLKKNKVLEKVADYANDQIALPRDIPLIGKSCGEPNAYWSPQTKEITYCYELVTELKPFYEKANESHRASSTRGRAAAVDEDIAGVTNGFLFHELGHGLVDLYDLPVTGKEEDAVDQLSTVMLASGDEQHQNYAVSTINAWAAWSEDEEALSTVDTFADEHSLSAQRYYNWACWLYGSDPKRFGSIVNDEVLPESRRERCPEEYGRIAKSWVTLLDPYLK